MQINEGSFRGAQKKSSPVYHRFDWECGEAGDFRLKSKPKNQTDSTFHMRMVRILLRGPESPPMSLQNSHQFYQCGAPIPGVEESIGLPAGASLLIKTI
jgi:hypothetical protein